MGDFKALVVLIGTSIWFFLFLFIVSVSGEAVVSDYIDVNQTIPAFCSSPRYALDQNNNEYEVIESSTRCIHTRASFDEEICGDIIGCTWENESSFLFWTTDAGCKGTISFQNYTNETLSIFSYYDICTFEDVQNQETCYNMGCTWNKASTKLDTQDTKGIMNLLGELFTFRYDFGFSGAFNTLIIFMTFYLPILIILGCVYFMIPFIH